MAKNVVTLNLDNTDYSFRPYGTCSTGDSTSAKTVNISGFTLCSGATVLIKFTQSNKANNITLNVNGTGAIPVQGLNDVFYPGVYYEFLYDGDDWVEIGERHNHRCSSYTANNNNYPYRRIASTNIVSTTNLNQSATLILKDPSVGGKYGELCINYYTATEGRTASYEIYWIINKGFSDDHIKLGFINTPGAVCMDVFYKNPSAWAALIVEQKMGGKKEGARHFDVNNGEFKFINSYEVYNTTTTDKLTSYECYKTIEDAATELYGKAYSIITAPNNGTNTPGKISFNGDLTGNAATATNANKLNNHDSSYFATASKQTELENQIKALAAGLTLNLTADPPTIYKNESKSITLTATVKDTAGNVNATSIVIKDGSTELKSASNTYTTNVSKSITTNNNTYTFTTTAVVNGMTLNKSVSISARNAVYYGMGNSASDVKTNGSKASARTSAVSNTTYDATASSNGERFYLLVPSDVTSPTSFSMGGAPVDMVIPSSTTTIDGIAYYVFYTNATYNSGGNVQIKAQ
jgi:hypothetical protein